MDRRSCLRSIAGFATFSFSSFRPVLGMQTELPPTIRTDPTIELQNSLVKEMNRFLNQNLQIPDREAAIDRFATKWRNVYGQSTSESRRDYLVFARDRAEYLNDEVRYEFIQHVKNQIINAGAPHTPERKQELLKLGNFMTLFAFTIEQTYLETPAEQFHAIFKPQYYLEDKVPPRLVATTFKAMIFNGSTGIQISAAERKDAATAEGKTRRINGMKDYIIQKIEDDSRPYGIVDGIPGTLAPYIDNRLEHLYLRIFAY